MTEKLPQRIRKAFVEAGYVNPRNGEPSVRQLADDLGMNNASLSRFFYQGSKMKLEAQMRVAEALEMDLSEMNRELGRSEVEPYSPPVAAHRLSFENRRLIDQLINALSRAEAGEEREDDSTTLTQAAGSAATPDPSAPISIFGTGKVIHTEEDTDDVQALAADAESHELDQ